MLRENLAGFTLLSI